MTSFKIQSSKVGTLNNTQEKETKKLPENMDSEADELKKMTFSSCLWPKYHSSTADNRPRDYENPDLEYENDSEEELFEDSENNKKRNKRQLDRNIDSAEEVTSERETENSRDNVVNNEKNTKWNIDENEIYDDWKSVYDDDDENGICNNWKSIYDDDDACSNDWESLYEDSQDSDLDIVFDEREFEMLKKNNKGNKNGDDKDKDDNDDESKNLSKPKTVSCFDKKSNEQKVRNIGKQAKRKKSLVMLLETRYETSDDDSGSDNENIRVPEIIGMDLSMKGIMKKWTGDASQNMKKNKKNLEFQKPFYFYKRERTEKEMDQHFEPELWRRRHSWE